MLHTMFTVYDCKVEGYLMPFFLKSRGEAIRGFSDVVNDSSSQFNKHPEDYTLFQLGTFDDDSCHFDLLDTPISLGKAIEFIR